MCAHSCEYYHHRHHHIGNGNVNYRVPHEFNDVCSSGQMRHSLFMSIVCRNGLKRSFMPCWLMEGWRQWRCLSSVGLMDLARYMQQRHVIAKHEYCIGSSGINNIIDHDHVQRNWHTKILEFIQSFPLTLLIAPSIAHNVLETFYSLTLFFYYILVDTQFSFIDQASKSLQHKSFVLFAIIATIATI